MISRGETSVASDRALRQFYQQSPSCKAGGIGKGNYEFCHTKYLSYLPVQFYNMRPTALLPLRRKARCRFLSPLAGFEPANLGSNDKHANH
jgi:hypothetical protein